MRCSYSTPAIFSSAIFARLERVELLAQDEVRVLEDRLDERQDVERVRRALAVEPRPCASTQPQATARGGARSPPAGRRARAPRRVPSLHLDDPRVHQRLEHRARLAPEDAPLRPALVRPVDDARHLAASAVGSRPSTSSSIPCETRKRETSGSGCDGDEALEGRPVPVDVALVGRLLAHDPLELHRIARRPSPRASGSR